MMSTKKGKRATLKMVAEKAGVTAGCVSLCLNDHPLAKRLSQETRERIFHAANSLQYTPSPLGRALKTGKSRIIGLVVPQISNNYFSILAQHVLEVAAERSYQLLIINQLPEEKEKRLLSFHEFLEGIISCVPLSPRETGCLPCIYIEGEEEKGKNTVRHDISSAMEQTAKEMKKKGHKKVWGVFDTAAAKENIFRQIFREQKLETISLPCPTSTREERKNTAQRLLEEKFPALVINGHLTTAQYFRYLDLLTGKRKTFFPDVAAICGYWNGELVHKNLLCVTITDTESIAEKAVKKLVNMIEKQKEKQGSTLVKASFYLQKEFSCIPFTDPEKEY